MASAQNSSKSSLESTSHTSPSPKTLSTRAQKKREADRRCQRIIRERTKSKIAALEEKVRNYENRDASEQVKVLVKKLEDVERERDSLANKVDAIEGILKISVSDVGNGKGVTTNNGNNSNDPMVLGDHDQTASSTTTQDASQESPHANSEWFDKRSVELTGTDSLPQAYNPDVQSFQVGSFNASYVEPAATQPCECQDSQATSAKKPRFNVWRFANEVLTSHFSWPSHVQLMEDKFRDDTPVRAIVEGWDAVEAQGPVHPTWQLLKKVDQVIFPRLDKRERIAVLYIMHLLLEAHLTPNNRPSLPEFYLRRPSEMLVHSYATEYFAWPGVRERFIFSEHRYCTNDFWVLLVQNLRLLWPFELRDCYVRNTANGLYRISPLFEDHLNDIKVWAMGPDMFKRWPELQGDIPAYNSIPGSVSNMQPGNQRLLSYRQTNQPVHHGVQMTTAASNSAEDDSGQSHLQSKQLTSLTPYAVPSSHEMGDNVFLQTLWTQDSTPQYDVLDLFEPNCVLTSSSHTGPGG